MLNLNQQIGICGLVNLSLLLSITIWRTVVFLKDCKYVDYATDRFKKKLAFHMLLLTTISLELPQFIAFIIKGRYIPLCYSFHTLSSAFFLMAFSLTIYDWGAVLYDIQEFKTYPIFLKGWTLFGINILYFLLSMVNFVGILAANNMNSTLDSTVYSIALAAQISLSFFLMCLMAHAGWTLSWRIQGAAGGVDNNSWVTSITTRFRNAAFRKKQGTGLLVQGTDVVNDFWRALRKLNIVVTTCTLCIALQILMLILNYAFGYEDDANKTVGPRFFFWTCYWWIPLWGPVTSLLYLNQRQSVTSSSPAMSASKRMFVTNTSDDRSPASSTAQNVLQQQLSHSNAALSTDIDPSIGETFSPETSHGYNSRGSQSGGYSFDVENANPVHSRSLGHYDEEGDESGNEAEILNKWHYST